jgi:hypothetical protein
VRADAPLIMGMNESYSLSSCRGRRFSRTISGVSAKSLSDLLPQALAAHDSTMLMPLPWCVAGAMRALESFSQLVAWTASLSNGTLLSCC